MKKKTGEEGTDTQAGEQIGKYRLARLLGQGGEGCVWLALHVRTQQMWALKFLHKKEGFQRKELQVLKRLQYPSLPRIVDVYETETQFILVMEYIQGISLDTLVNKDRRLSMKQVMDVALQISAALSYLHERVPPILHLDLKPANIILGRKGRLYLVDFGASTTICDQESCRKGTDGYAAPEQYDPSVRLDESADVFGLGAVLYRLVAGKCFSVILHGSRIPGCGEPLSQILGKCLEPSREKRYANATLLHKELQRATRMKTREKGRVRFWAAAWLFLLAGTVAARGVGERLLSPLWQEKDYHSMLLNAKCASEQESLDWYRQALLLKPGREEAWLEYLEWRDEDELLSAEEDRELHELLYTVPAGKRRTLEELLKQNRPAFEKVSCRIGLLYWFDYPGTEGHRIAAGWFRKAVEVQADSFEPETDDGEIPGSSALQEKPQHEETVWRVTARVFLCLGEALQGRESEQREKGDTCGQAAERWNTMGRLLNLSLSSLERVRWRMIFYEACLDRIILDCPELMGCKVTEQELMERIAQIEQMARKEKTGDAKADIVLAKAKRARERVRMKHEHSKKEQEIYGLDDPGSFSDFAVGRENSEYGGDGRE